MLNIVIPMAGRGSRFLEKGYLIPKPLIPIHSKPMISYVIDNLTPSCEHRFIFLCLKEHIEQFKIDQTLRELCPSCEIVEVNRVTEGAACTVLLAEEYINNDNPLMIANSDQYVDINLDDYLQLSEEESVDGLIMTMNAYDNKWSFIRWDDEGYVIEVKEKEVISKEATVGIYNFAKGKDFVLYAKQMISENARVNGEFYVAPVYNYMIMHAKKIRYYNVGDLASVMFGLGVPGDLELFLSLPISKRIAAHL